MRKREKNEAEEELFVNPDLLPKIGTLMMREIYGEIY